MLGHRRGNPAHRPAHTGHGGLVMKVGLSADGPERRSRCLWPAPSGSGTAADAHRLLGRVTDLGVSDNPYRGDDRGQQSTSLKVRSATMRVDKLRWS